MGVQLLIFCPDGKFFSQRTFVEELVLPTLTGEIGIFSSHAPLMTALDTGVLRYKVNSKWNGLYIRGGVASVINNLVTVNTGDCERITKANYEEYREAYDQACIEASRAVTLQERISSGDKLKRFRATIGAYQYLD